MKVKSSIETNFEMQRILLKSKKYLPECRMFVEYRFVTSLQIYMFHEYIITNEGFWKYLRPKTSKRPKTTKI